MGKTRLFFRRGFAIRRPVKYSTRHTIRKFHKEKDFIMSGKKLTVTGTGDSLFVVPFPPSYDPMLAKIAGFIGSCDVRLTNLETNLSDFEFCGNAYSGGTWLNTRRKYLDDLTRFGFNFYGNANNHAMDYGHPGLLSTIGELDARKLAHAGTGRSLEEAAAPAVLSLRGHRIAVFAVDASMADPSRAGRATHDLPARPGVNYLRHKTSYRVTEEELSALRSIASKIRINFQREMQIATGYQTPDPEGVFHFGELEFTTDSGVADTRCHAGDKKRLLDAVREAKKSCSLVFMLVHCHDDDGICHGNPPSYYREFAHDCIESGVSAIFGGGCHSLRGIEIYRGAPIFYSLGDFIYQGPQVEILPADFMEKYGIDIFSSAKDALWTRSRGGKVGLHCEKCNYQTVLPKLEFTDGVMTGFKLLPVHLNFERQDDLKGLPVPAEGDEAQVICRILDELSAQFGTRLKLENGFIVRT